MTINILLFGATGAVGREVIECAALSAFNGVIYAPVRSESKLRSVLTSVSQVWCKEHLRIVEMAQMDSEVQPWIASLAADVKTAISCVGTTLAAAGSAEKFRAVDLDLNLVLAKACFDKGIENYHLVSATGASSSSLIMYSRTKGELEDKVTQLGFPRLSIYRPTLLLTEGARDQSRPMEAVGQCVARWTDWFGIWSVPTRTVGQAIFKSVVTEGASAPGVRILNVNQIRQIVSAK